MGDVFYSIFGRYGWLRHALPTWARTIPFRLRHGFDYRDCWNLDIDLADWLGKRLVHLARVTNTTPATYIYKYEAQETDGESCQVAFDIWRYDLKRHGEALTEYAEQFVVWDRDEEKTIQDAKDAMKFVAENLTGLWD